MARRHIVWLALIVVGDVLMAVAAHGSLPDRVPVHWNIYGHVDRYGSPWELSLVFPIIVIVTAGVLMGLPALVRSREPIARSPAIYGRVALAVVAALVALHAVVLRAALGLGAAGRPIDVSFVMLIISGVLLVVVGNWMGKIRRNELLGIRTPWTLKSDLVWERTHRIGGRLQVAHGLAVLLAAILLPTWAAIAVLVGGLLALCAWVMIYSRRIFREEAAGR